MSDSALIWYVVIQTVAQMSVLWCQCSSGEVLNFKTLFSTAKLANLTYSLLYLFIAIEW